MSKMRYGLYLGATALAGAMCLDPGAGHAQAVPSASPVDAIISLLQTLKNCCIYVDVDYTEDFIAVVSGGHESGNIPIVHYTTPAEFDLESIVGITSATVH